MMSYYALHCLKRQQVSDIFAPTSLIVIGLELKGSISYAQIRFKEK